MVRQSRHVSGIENGRRSVDHRYLRENLILLLYRYAIDLGTVLRFSSIHYLNVLQCLLVQETNNGCSPLLSQ